MATDPMDPNAGPSMIRLNLSFAAISCQGCGVRRQAGLECPDCGARPAITEVDIHLQRRQRAVRVAREARQSPVEVPLDGPMDLIGSSRLPDVMDKITRAPGLVADEKPAGTQELAQAAREIAALEGWVQNASELRPWAAYSRTVKAAVSSIVRAFDVILDALEAPSIAAAQATQADLQSFLDEASAAIDDSITLLERFGRIHDSDNPCAAWLNEAIESDPMSAAARGADLLKANQLDSGCIDAQIVAVVWDTVLGTISDVETFWKNVADHHRFLCLHRATVLEAVASDSFGERLIATREDALTAAYRVAMMGDAETLRQGVTDLLEHGHQLVEQPLKLHLGILSACVSRKPFDKTQAQDASALIQVAAQHLPQATTPLGVDIRNAMGHRDYSVTEDGRIELSPALAAAQGRSPVTVSQEELCDAVIRIAEDCAIMETALVVLCGDKLEQTSIAYSSFLIRTISEGFLGWADIAVESTPDEILLKGRCLRRVKHAELAMLACLPLEGRDRLRLRLQDMGLEEHEIVVPVDKFIEWSGREEGVQKTVAFIDMLRYTGVDGQPIMHDGHTSKAVAVAARQCLADKSMAFPELRVKLAAWRDAAREWNHERLAKAIATAIGWRAGAPHSGGCVDTLTEFASQEVEELDEWML